MRGNYLLFQACFSLVSSRVSSEDSYTDILLNSGPIDRSRSFEIIYFSCRLPPTPFTRLYLLNFPLNAPQTSRGQYSPPVHEVLCEADATIARSQPISLTVGQEDADLAHGPFPSHFFHSLFTHYTRVHSHLPSSKFRAHKPTEDMSDNSIIPSITPQPSGSFRAQISLISTKEKYL